MADILGSNNRRIKGSLVLRILLVCAILLVIPLIIYDTALFKTGYDLKLKELLLELELIANTHYEVLNGILQGKEQNLRTMKTLLDFENDKDINIKLNKLAEEQEFDGLFYLKRLGDENYVCIASTKTEIIGKEYPLTSKILNCVTDKKYAFLSEDPNTGGKDVYFLFPIVDEELKLKGILVGHTDAKWLIGKMKKADILEKPFDIALLDEKGEIFTSSDSDISMSKMIILSLEEIEQNKGQEIDIVEKQRSLFEKGKGVLGLQEGVENTTFYLVVRVPNYKMKELSDRTETKAIAKLLIVIFGLGTIAVFLVSLRMAKPLEQLINNMQEAGEGNLKTRFRKDKMGFEINFLGENFNKMVENLVHHIETIKKERTAKEALKKELEIGRDVQNKLLPHVIPELKNLEIASKFIAAREVGGDFYDFIKKGDKLFFSIADVSGKGISACLYSLGMRSILRSYIDTYDDITDIIVKANNMFYLDTEEDGMFVTLWLGIYDSKTNKLEYISCGHPPAYLFKETGEVVELRTQENMALGVQKIDNVVAKEISLSPGDKLFLLTDGAFDAQNKKREMFGTARVLEALRLDKEKKPQDAIDNFFKQIQEFSSGTEQYDDLTAVAIYKNS